VIQKPNIFKHDVSCYFWAPGNVSYKPQNLLKIQKLT